jgi:dipeptidyl aminopeptidase/acylaminoacyl peptidase
MMSRTKPAGPTRRLLGGLAAFSIVCLAMAVPAFAAEAAASTKSDATLPPLIDREAFFGDPEISGAQLSPNGKYVSFVKPLDGTRNIWVKKIDEPFEAARPLTDDTKRPITGYFWSRDSKYILFVQDDGGDENFNIFAVDPKAKTPEGKKVPPARNLTDLDGVRAIIYSVPKTDEDKIYVGLNDRDAAWHDLYEVTISTGERELLRENTENIASWFFDLKGNLRLAARTTDDGSTEILSVDDEGFEPVYTCSVFESCTPIRFHEDGKRVYMITNRGDDVDLTRLVLFDPKKGEEKLVESDPEERVDFGSPVFSEKTDELVATVYNDERRRIYFRDDEFEEDFRFLDERFEGLEISPASSTEDERLWLISVNSDREPGERWLFDRETRELEFQYRVFEELPREHLAPMKAISYESSDGLEIPAFLTLPKGVKPKRLPLVVFPHGGPWARDGWGYDAYAQFLANRGFAVLQPNFRGSTGYGKDFLNAGNGEWGDLMQDDLTWGVKHLVKEGTVDKKRVAIMGGSYGGYATLAGVAFTPDVYAAAVSIVGPSNLLTLLDSIPPYWESIRKVFYERMADPNTPEGKAQLMRQSPLFSADEIETPLLVVQGANDPRVKQAESDQIVVALRERDFPVEYLVAPDEGHGFRRPVNNMAMIAATERFFAKHVGTRHQEEMPDDVAKRLEEISVDVATVTLPEELDPTKLATPEPVKPLEAYTVKYASTINAGGQEMAVDSELTIAEEGETWVLTESASMPMGDVKDRTVVDGESLVVLSRKIEQGPVTIEVDVAEGTLEGTMLMGGEERPISVDLEGPLFGDGAGAGHVIGRLPLEVGYEAIYRIFDVQTAQAKLRRLKVAAVESVTTPAGTFETFKLEIDSPEGEPGGQTMWIDKESRKLVKSTAVLPSMGGATVETELVP